MTEEHKVASARQRLRRLAGALARVAAFGSAFLIVVGLAGQAIRDRSVATALDDVHSLDAAGTGGLGVRPPLSRSFVASASIRIDDSGCRRDRLVCNLDDGPWSDRQASYRRRRDLLCSTGTSSGAADSSAVPMTWKALCSAIVDRYPDLVVLSEAPPDDWIRQLTDDLGAGASYVGIFHGPRSPHWYRMAVCSRWPIRLEETMPIPGGMAMSVTAEVSDRRLRLLVVNGASSPLRSRLPFLRAINEACRKATEGGRPYDFVVGDFNTPSRSIGFDALSAQGYRLASWSTSGWRGTFPAWLPVYDIDHVWIAPRLRTRSCSLFNSPWTDHRGQIVRVQVGDLPAGAAREPRTTDRSTVEMVRLIRLESDPEGPSSLGPRPTSRLPWSSTEASNP